MKVKIWCEKMSRREYVVEEIGTCVHIKNEEIVDIDLNEIITPLGKDGYYYSNNLYYYIHKKYKYIDIFTYDGDDLEYEIIEKGYKDDIPFIDTPLISLEQFDEIMKE